MKYVIASIVGFLIGFVGVWNYWQNVQRPNGADAEGVWILLGGVGLLCAVIAVSCVGLFDTVRHKAR